MTLAWHFVSDTLRDGRPVPEDGEWLEHDGALVLCKSGLHASEDTLDALQYAPGNTLCRVECAGEMLTSRDKLVCTRRKILWRIDAEPVLRQFARWCALEVIDKWDAPDVVRGYLETGREDLRAAAWAAARDAARAATSAAAWAAARAAAWAAACAAARAATRAATSAAAWAAARAAANAAWDAQREKLLALIEQAREVQGHA